jgi:hypothetical protein
VIAPATYFFSSYFSSRCAALSPTTFTFHHGLPTVTKIARRAYTLDNPIVPTQGGSMGWPAPTRPTHAFARLPSLPTPACIFLPEAIAPRSRPHTFLAGGHRSSVELRPSRNPSSNRRRRCRAGVAAHPRTGTSEMCRLCCDHLLLT